MPQSLKAVLAFVAIVPLAACATATDEAALIADPLEPVNRVSHQINRGVDTVVLSPAAHAYDALPDPIETGLSNFSSNLALPSDMMNNALQGDLGGFLSNLSRFALNSTLGVGGLFDIATEAGVPRQEADFGQTLALWGAGEGAYLELPLLGPGTTRSQFGTLVDIISDPLGGFDSQRLEDARTAGTVIGVVAARDAQRGPIDRVLYETDDSYSSLRDAYVQNRRAQISGTDDRDDGFIDLYDE